MPPTAIAGGNEYVLNHQAPSVDANGKYIFHTGTQYASWSRDNGATWHYANPFVAFPSPPGSFCCNQVSLYEPGRNSQFWLLQYNNHLTLARSPGNDLTTWCSYSFTPPNVGLPASSRFDYNDLAFSNNHLYLATNVLNSAGIWTNSVTVRMPLDELAACAALNFSHYAATDWVMFKPVQGATDVMYWASVTPANGVGLGTAVRLYSLAENSASVISYDRTVPAFAYMSRNSGQNCASTSGNVTNWCEFADSRAHGGYVSRGVLGFSFNAKQDGSHPFPYTRLVRFLEGTKRYLNGTDFYSSQFAIQYMSWAPNARGHVASIFAWGGGTVTDWYPASGYVVQDDFGSTAGYLGPGGNSNACMSGETGLYRWGDYLSIRAYHPAKLVWIASAMRNVNGGPCTGPPTTAYSEVRNFVFGRERDANSYHRWKNS